MQRNIAFPRQQSLVVPEVENPFYHRIHFNGIYDAVKFTVMSVTLAPIRLLMAGVCLILAWPFASLALWGRSAEEQNQPMAGWRNMLRPIVVFFCRGVFFSGGFHWLTVKGTRATAKEAPILVMAPHSSFYDALFVTYLDLTSVVAKTEAQLVPLFGVLTTFTQPVYVSREDPDSRANTIREIQRRADTGGKWPQVIVFAEGTCTNRSCLISFKQGAFCPGVAVQPVCVRYPNKMDTFTWTWDGPGAWTLLWYTVCQFHNYIEIEYLPVYNPSAEEIANPKLFASNVRAVMAKCLQVPITEHTYDDCRLMMRAARNKLPMVAGLIEFYKLHIKLGLTYERMQELFDEFCKICADQTGHISLTQFAEHLRVPESEPALQKVFDMYDRDSNGTIDFREYVIGLSLVSGPANTEDTIQLAFQLFDTGNKGHITEEELVSILNHAFAMSQVDVGQLFKEVDANGDGKITYDEFRACAANKPEYARLFTAYQEMKQQPQGNGHPGMMNAADIPGKKLQ